MSIMIGSARHDENGKYTGGAAGDQLQKSSTNDTTGEVSMQSFYVHSKGWYILRPKTVANANAIAEKMKTACNNANIGYDQNNRLGIISKGINTTEKTECDCSSLVRQVVKEATGKDPGNFTTASEKSILLATGLFDDIGAYASNTTLYNGDILVTKSKGHTVVVVSGNARSEESNVNKKVESNNNSKTLTVDGKWGTETCKRAQEVFGTTVDGVISGQSTSLKKYHAGVSCAKYATKGTGSQLIKAIQKKVGVTQDGLLGQNTIKAMQKWHGTTQDGKISNPSAMVKAFQRWLNKQ